MLALAAAGLLIQAVPITDPCAYDRAARLALDEHAFDQDMEGGWRALARDPRCHVAAADLLRDYRAAHGNDHSILIWHEGQMRAMAGQAADAIALFDRARHPDPDGFGWNLYVDASIAFLRGDRPALIAARDALAALPRPADFAPRDPLGRAISVSWPPNLNIVDGFVACFGRSYREAYGTPRCAPPPADPPAGR